MKCPNCGFDRILPMYKVCPKCKQPLSHSDKSISSTQEPEFSSKSELSSTNQAVSTNLASSKDVDTISIGKDHKQHFITWSIAPGQIARNIPVQEFLEMAEADGVYIQEGVTAVLFIDGAQAAEIGGGIYSFAKENRPLAQREKAEEDYEVRAKEGLVQKLGRLGKSIAHFFYHSAAAIHQERKEERERMREHLRRITSSSVVSVVLKRDGIVNFTMGIRPIVTEDGNHNVEFAPYKIRTQSLTVDVALALEARITNFQEFRTTYLMDRNSYGVNDLRIALNTFMRTTLQRSMQYYAADGDLLPEDLMASISYDLMTRSIELLHGIAISNVLDITTENEAFDRFRAIEEKLFCTDKEIDYLTRTNQFKNRLQSVENQQKIDEAQSEFDLRKELDRINNDKLIHEDEMDAFVQLLQSQKRIREARTENEELSALLELKGNRLLSEDEYDAIESSIRDKKFEREQLSLAFQLTAANRTENVRLQVESQLTKSKLLAEAELNDIRFEELRKAQTRQFELDEAKQEHELTSSRRKDEYLDARQEIEHKRQVQTTIDQLELEKKKNQNDLDLLRQKAELARQNMQTMQQHEKEMAEIKHQEEMARISASQNMTAEQLMAAGAAGLSAEAQKAFAEALAAGKGTEREREMYERILQMQANQSQQVMAAMQGALQTNASMAASISGARIAEEKKLKEEYREQMEHEQKRIDATQDKALNYTTKVTQEKIKASAKTGDKDKKAEKAPYYLPDFGANYSLKEIGNLILNGTIDPETELEFNGETLTVAEVDELLPFLEKKYGNE